MSNQFDEIPEKGKRYRLKSRPWDSSYLEVRADPQGAWIFDPPDTECQCDKKGLKQSEDD